MVKSKFDTNLLIGYQDTNIEGKIYSMLSIYAKTMAIIKKNYLKKYFPILHLDTKFCANHSTG